MCGLAGIIRFQDELVESDKLRLEHMLSNLYHRGPDQQGIIHHPDAFLGNQRLKMQDLSDNGFLPIHDEEDDIVLAFNGEISNHIEIIQKYQLGEKYHFKSTSDTEVFLNIYREFGIEGLQYLSGMFAFILHDRKKKKIFWGRDFFGINPLFYSMREGKIIIASELKAFDVFHLLPTEINVQAIYDLFTLAYIPSESTPYKSISEVLPGTYFELSIDSNTYEEKRYFNFKFRPKEWSEDAAIKATREVLLNSTERHLRSDAPIGSMLSGGIDTSSLVGMAKHLGLSKNLHTFSLSIQDANFDESFYQKVMAEYAGTNHHQINVGIEEILAHFEEHIAFMDEPYGHGAALPTYLLAKEAQKYVKGLLSGEGGDEIFNAYETHGAHYWKNKYLLIPKGIRSAIRNSIGLIPLSHGKLSLDFKLKRFCEGVELPIEESHIFWRHVLKEDMKEGFFNQSCLPTQRLGQQYFKDLGELDDYSKLSSWDIEFFFFGDLMVKNDRMCLAHSVESRFPYMDREVTDLVMTIPSHIRMKGSVRRFLQKEAMKPFLPKVIYERSGFGLELPYNKWFLGDLKPLYEKYFNSIYFENLPFLNWKKFETLLQLHQTKKMDLGRFLWTVLILCCWYDINFIKKNGRKIRESVYEKSQRLILS